MLKELVARVALVFFIIGLATDAAPDGGNSGPTKQPRSGQPSNSADTPRER
jgi:hypothetical protein